MLATAQANIPPELRQCLEIVPGSVKPLELTGFEKNSKPIIKFLTYSSGLATDYQVVFCGNVLTVNRVRRQAAVYNYKLQEGAEIVAVEYLQTSGGKFGLAVLYNDGEQAFLARLVHNGDHLKPVHETVIPFPGSCLKVVIDDIDIVQAAASLNERMRQWCNIVVVGTEFGHAYVFYLPENPNWTLETQPESRKLTDALFSFHRGKKFLYRMEGRHDVVKEPSEVRVTAIAYIPRSCDLLLGLSFGGIVQVGFTPTGDIAANAFQCSSPVCHLVPMLPHDDPNMNVWFWAMHGERGKTVVMVLYEGSYRVIGQENVPTRDREFRKAMFFPRMADQLAGKGTIAEWICAHTLARERKLDDLTRIGDTMGCNATLNDTDLDISQMFFSYIDSRGTTKFGIFDLNTYYYKRLNERPIPDSTAAKQCPYLIDVALEPSEATKSLENITDIMADCSYITRFQFLADDPEQQIYASGLNLNRIYVGSSTVSATFQLRSLPSQVLERIYENLNSYTRNWRDAAQRLLAVGLMPLPLEVSASVQGGSASSLLYGVTSYEMVMTAAIFYGYTDSVVELINNTTVANWSSVRNKSEWMWSEIQRARNKVDMLNDVLFSEAAKELSVDQKRQLRQLNAVLRSAKRIYRAIQEKYVQWERADIVPRVLVLEIESQLAAVNNVSDFSNCIRNLYTMKYLPLGERNTEERQILEDMVRERRRKLRVLPSPRNLFIDDIVAKMQKIEPDEPFWLDQEGEEWYPPAVHNAVTPLLKATYHDRLKQDFIIYYTIDLVMAKKTLQAGIDEPDMRKIIFHVTEILDDVLRIGEKEITAVFNKWHQEQQQDVKEFVVEEPMGVSHTVMEELEEKLDSLLKKAEKLTVEEENSLKALCNKIPYGQFRYQLYLIERSRYNEVEILTVPSNVHNRHVDVYAKALPAIRKVKQYLQPLLRVNNGPQFPQEVVEKFGNFVPPQKPTVDHGKRGASGANVPLYKRIRKLPTAEPEEVEICQAQEIISTPQRFETNEAPVSEVTPVMNKLDEETKQKINSILRTPTSRRARAAAAAEGQTGVEVTPETQVFLPAPHSILKTPVRHGEHPSPSRGRLRWDPEFVEPSIDNSAVSSVSESPKTVAFEDSPEPETVNPEEVSQTIEEQSEGSNEDPEDSDTSVEALEEAEPILEKLEAIDHENLSQTVEEQSDGTIDGVEEPEPIVEVEEQIQPTVETVDAPGEEVEQDEQEDEVNDQTPELTTAVRLVDYSVTESTFSATPTRADPGKTTFSKKWIDDGGTEHSFEQQEDDEEEDPTEKERVTVIATRVVVETIQTPDETVPETFATPPVRSEETMEVPTTSPSPKVKKPSSPAQTTSCRKLKGPVSARLIKNPLSKEPEAREVKRARRSISETPDIGASVPESHVEPRRSARKRTPSRTETEAGKVVRRALFIKEQSGEQSISRVLKDKSRSKSPSREVEPETRRSSPRRTQKPSDSGAVEEEATSSRKSPSRRARSASKTTEDEPKTPTRRITRTESPLLATVSQSSEPKSTGRGRIRSVSRTESAEPTTPTRKSRTRTPSEVEGETVTPSRRSTRTKPPVLPTVAESTTEAKSCGCGRSASRVEPETPTRRSRTRTPSRAPEESVETRRCSRKTVTEPSAAKSPARRPRTTIPEEVVTEPEVPPIKRGRPPKTEGSSLVVPEETPEAEPEAVPKKRGRPPKTEGSSLVAQFRANLAKRTAYKPKAAPIPKRGTASTSTENNDAPGSSRKGRTQSESSSEPAPKMKKSPGRPRKNPVD